MFIAERDHTEELKTRPKTYTYYSIEERYQDPDNKKIKTNRIEPLGPNPSPKDLEEAVRKHSLQELRKELFKSFYRKVGEYENQYESFQAFLKDIDQPDLIYELEEEMELHDFLLENFEKVFDNLELYPNKKEAREFYLGEDYGHVDILAREKDTSNLAVIELKVGEVTDQVIGQVLKYMSGVEEQIADGGNVNCIVIGKEFTGKYEKAYQKVNPDIERKKIQTKL